MLHLEKCPLVSKKMFVTFSIYNMITYNIKNVHIIFQNILQKSISTFIMKIFNTYSKKSKQIFEKMLTMY